MLGPESETAWKKAGSQLKLGRWRSLTVRDMEKQAHVYTAFTYREKTESTIKWWKETQAHKTFLTLRPKQSFLTVEFKFYSSYSFIYKSKASDLPGREHAEHKHQF